jgi:hypothetical protein
MDRCSTPNNTHTIQKLELYLKMIYRYVSTHSVELYDSHDFFMNQELFFSRGFIEIIA